MALWSGLSARTGFGFDFESAHVNCICSKRKTFWNTMFGGILWQWTAPLIFGFWSLSGIGLLPLYIFFSSIFGWRKKNVHFCCIKCLGRSQWDCWFLVMSLSESIHTCKRRQASHLSFLHLTDDNMLCYCLHNQFVSDADAQNRIQKYHRAKNAVSFSTIPINNTLLEIKYFFPSKETKTKSKKNNNNEHRTECK